MLEHLRWVRKKKSKIKKLINSKKNMYIRISHIFYYLKLSIWQNFKI